MRPSQEKRRVRRQLEALARLPRHEAIGTVAQRRAPERGAAPLVAGNVAQQVSRQDPHVVDGVVEHLGVAPPEPEHRGERVARRHRADPMQRRPVGRVHARVVVGVVGEHHVGRRDGASVLPARPRVQVEHQRQGAVPLPPLREQRREVLVAQRVGRKSDVGELEEDLIAHVAAHGRLPHGGQQRVGLAHGREHQRAAVFTDAAAAVLASAEREAEQARERRRSTAARQGSRHGA